MINLINNEKGKEDALKLMINLTNCKNNKKSFLRYIKNIGNTEDNEEIDIPNTYLSRILNLNDLLQWYLLLIHFYEYNNFPEEIFYSGNRNYLIHNDYFTIKWSENKPENFNRYIKVFEKLLKTWPINVESKEHNESYSVLVINYIELGKFLALNELNNKIINIIEEKNNLPDNTLLLKLKEYQFDQEKVRNNIYC